MTATGRVSLHEPSIQNVPRDFEVVATPQLLKKALGTNVSMEKDKTKNWNKSGSFFDQISQFLMDDPLEEEDSMMSVSLRSESIVIPTLKIHF